MIPETLQKIEDWRKLRESYAAVFNNPDNPGLQEHGQRVLRHLCKLGFWQRTTFVPGDVHQTCRNEGARRLLLEILTHIYKHESELLKELERQYETAP
jgi:hypothetical protein